MRGATAWSTSRPASAPTARATTTHAGLGPAPAPGGGRWAERLEAGGAGVGEALGDSACWLAAGAAGGSGVALEILEPATMN